MTHERDAVPVRVAELLDWRPVRWVPTDRLVGDYEGRERTLEVFDVAARDQRMLLRRLRSLREEIEEKIGGPLIVIFHTPRETERLYAEEIQGVRDGKLDLDRSGLRFGYQQLGQPIPSFDSAPVELTGDATVADPPYEGKGME